MNDPRKKNPTFGIGVFIVVVVLIVIGTVLFNAIRSKREYDEARSAGTAASVAASVAASAAAPASPAQP